ncbi:hypothetical protein TWF481_010266 [Arthrobotrys musiformis]|uniref:Uncharacterized protein n=1 Tax=Arthrobotrys musiformis TaxID=47236 RepID=A0AAV9W1N4_9PEZI
MRAFIILIFLYTHAVRSWYLLPLRQDRKFTPSSTPSSKSWLEPIDSLTACISNDYNRNNPGVITAFALYNRPNTPAAKAVGIYNSQFCGKRELWGSKWNIKIGTHVPDVLLLPDQRDIYGVHLFDVRDVGVETSGRFYRAINPDEEIGMEGLLAGSGVLPGIYWWDGKGSWKRKRHFLEGKVKVVSGKTADWLVSPTGLYGYIRLLLEYFVNPERMEVGEEKALEGYVRVARREEERGGIFSAYSVPAPTGLPLQGAGAGNGRNTNPNLRPGLNGNANRRPALDVNPNLRPTLVYEADPNVNRGSNIDINTNAINANINTNVEVQRFVPPAGVQPQYFNYLPIQMLPIRMGVWTYEQLKDAMGSVMNQQVLRGIQDMLGLGGLPNPAPFTGLEGGVVQPEQQSDGPVEARVPDIADIPAPLLPVGEVIVVDSSEDDDDSAGDSTKKRVKTA